MHRRCPPEPQTANPNPKPPTINPKPCTGWRVYWKEGWNRFDFALVVLAILDLAVSSLHLSFLRALRVLRAQRLLRLLRNSSVPAVRRV